MSDLHPPTLLAAARKFEKAAQYWRNEGVENLGPNERWAMDAYTEAGRLLRMWAVPEKTEHILKNFTTDATS